MSQVPAAFLEGSVTSADGRDIAFAQFGTPNGRPIFWLHGTPGGRRQVPAEARRIAADQGLRIIGIDRPGIGGSSAHTYDAIADFADDLDVIADRLGCDEFAVVGLSGGGPYTLACAHALPDRVTAAAVLGGVAPTCGPDAAPGGIVRLASYFEPVVRAVSEPLGLGLAAAIWPLRPFASPLFEAYALVSPEADRRIFAQPEIKEMFLDDILLASRWSMRAPLYDVVLFGRDWGFRLGDIQVPVRFWHGDADHLVPLEHGYWQAERIPDAELRVRPGESHLGGLGAAAEVLDAILGLWPDPR